MRALPRNHWLRLNHGLLAGLVVCAIAATSQAEDEITVGCDSTGKLKVKVEFALPAPLPPSVFPGVTGFATGEVGIHSALFDEALEDFFQLTNAVADFRMILLTKTPGTEVWNDHGSAVMATNESYFLGEAPFDSHALWNIASTTSGGPYRLTLKVRDVSGIYLDSEPFELTFTPDTAPGPFEIRIARTDATHAELTWPTNAVGWELQSSASLASGMWSAVTNAPANSSTNFTLSLSTSLERQFYRLRRP